MPSGQSQDLGSLRKLISLALEATGGHQRRAAASLGIRPTTLSEKLRRLGMRQRRAKELLPESAVR
jgi:DNA-binding NtrC family response regulator